MDACLIQQIKLQHLDGWLWLGSGIPDPSVTARRMYAVCKLRITMICKEAAGNQVRPGAIEVCQWFLYDRWPG